MRSLARNKIRDFFHGGFTDLLLSGLVLFAFSPLHGQKIVPSPADIYDEAVEYMFAGDYSEALPLFLSLDEKGYDNANISYKIGECFLQTEGRKAEALPYLKNAVTSTTSHYTDSLSEIKAPIKAFFYLGIAFRLNYNFTAATAAFESYLNLLEAADEASRMLVQYHIDRCRNAEEMISAPSGFKCDTLPDVVNTLFSNSRPLVNFHENTLFYMEQLKFYDAIMQSDRADSLWLIPVNLTPMVRSDGDHYLTGLSADGNALLLFLKDPYKNGELFVARKENDRWGEMTKLNDNINSMFNETHASFSSDGKQLYFTSDRKGGYGGLDIYRSELTDQGWGIAVNLGPLINTPYNEESPFITYDSGRLFFSSQGHYNMGGYDIFMSVLDGKGQWLPPVNIGYPINTPDDDLFYFPLGSGTEAYQARFTGGSRQSDIVRFSNIIPGNPKRFTIIGSTAHKADPGYDLTLIRVEFIDKVTNVTLGDQHLAPNGTFTQKLPAGKFVMDFSENGKSIMTRELELPDYLPQQRLVVNTVLEIRPVLSDTLSLRDLLFAFDNSVLDTAYLHDLDKLAALLMKYPDIRLMINGYTDTRGSEAYNRALSLRRANAVADYIKKDGHLAPRISVSGLGEERPVAINQFPDGTDNPEGRKFNRRVEIVVENIPSSLHIVKADVVPLNVRIK
jgi:outer membrane protein OmpA-like peptidoglycan-associated protein